MKYILFILALAISGLGMGQDLTVSNQSAYTASEDATYVTITLGNDSEFTIPEGITITANTLDIENHATINLQGVLNILEDIDVNNDGTLEVNNTGIMDIGGNVTAKNNSTLKFDGNIQIDGDLTIGNALLTVAGTVNVDGAFTGSVDNGDGTLTSGNFNNYNQPLPVKLLYASASAQQETIEVKWATASETNNDFYTI
ncbi:MAG: hypothetical protein PF489_06035, partial [Salinivirgaceae bacterium]|nr:hypothetical protein [Salinivirgaceae bacterium]